MAKTATRTATIPHMETLKCEACGAKIKIARTVPQKMDDGRTLLTRYLMPCEGPRSHRFPPIKQILS